MPLPDGVELRELAAFDLDRVIELERECKTAPHWGPAHYRLYVEDSKGSSKVQRCGLAATLGETLAGFVLLRILRVSATAEVELESILVDPALRRRGIGARLMAGSMGMAEKYGAHRLDLEVRSSNQEAIRLYQRLGMSEAGRRPGYYRDPEEDAVLMRVEW